MDRHLQAITQIECQQFLNRVTMLMDEGQWQDLANCYTEDAVLFRPSDANTGIVGRSAIVESFKARPPRTSCHILANSVFEIKDSEKVIAKSRVWLVAGEASDVFPVKGDGKLMVGSFIDTLIRVDNQWLIKCRKGTIELTHKDSK